MQGTRWSKNRSPGFLLLTGDHDCRPSWSVCCMIKQRNASKECKFGYAFVEPTRWSRCRRVHLDGDYAMQNVNLEV